MKLVRIIFFPVVAAAFGLVFWLKGFEIHAPFGLTFAASFIAAGIIFDQWKRSIFVTGSALGAALIFWNGGITLGIDLAGGGELRYRFDTGDIEAEEAGLLAQKERLEEGGDRTALAARVEDIGEQLRAEGDAEKRAKLDSEKAELEEKIREIRSLEEKIRATRSKKSGHAENALSIIRKRIDPTGMQEMSVQALGADEIIIRIPYRKPEGVDDHREAQRQFSEKIDRIKKLIEKQGVLHFYIVNDKQADWLTKAKEAFEALKPIPNRCLYVAPYKDFMAKSREAFNKGVDLGRLGVISHSEPKGEDVGKPQPPMLLKAGSLADGSIIHYASATLGDEGFQVNMVFTNEGSQVFWDITSKHRGERMAIVLDDMMHSAPNIKEPIRARGRITGNFDPQEASILAEVLTAGSLPMKVKFQSSVIIGPGMGSDSVMKGVRSIAMAGVLVLVFMAVYYLSGGLVADLALLLNLVYILGAMSLFHATLTLPGIAGILLTVGMAVDANILIFERIREEKARGRVLRLAVQAGYDRAFVTIMDAQITTLITAIILYYVGTGPVKGFAVTLMMGIVAGLFTSLYVTRLVIEFLVAKNVMKSLAMLRLIGETALPFVKARFGAFVLSAAVIGVGIWGFVTHEHKYGIDFAGGTRILVEYEAEKGTDEARAHIAAAFEKIAAEAEAAGDPETAKRPPARG